MQVKAKVEVEGKLLHPQPYAAFLNLNLSLNLLFAFISASSALSAVNLLFFVAGTPTRPFQFLDQHGNAQGAGVDSQHTYAFQDLHDLFLRRSVFQGVADVQSQAGPEEVGGGGIDGDIDKLGKFLALEKKQSIEENNKIISELDTLLQKLEN